MSAKKGMFFESEKMAQQYERANVERMRMNSNAKLSPSSITKDDKSPLKASDPNETINKNYWHRGELMELVDNPLEELEYCTEVVIEQKIELLEVLTGYETPNRYHVYMLTNEGKKKYLFKCKEESSWGCRNCCPSNSRGFEMKLIHIRSSVKAPNYKRTIANFSRPFVCTCCCLKRPTFKAMLTASNDEPGMEIGSVVENFSCDPTLSVFTENKKLKWKVKSKYCQCGFFCRSFSLGKCYEIDFWIYDGADTRKERKAVGNIHKVFKGISELITDSDAFLLTFPKNSTTTEKLMLIGSVLMIDYRYYEEMALCNFSSIV